MISKPVTYLSLTTHLVASNICITRWNSHYEAVKKVIAADSKLPEVWRALGLPTLLQADVAFLKEYLIIMAPLAAILDILQGDKHTSLATVTVLKKRLGALQLRYTEALRDKLLQRIETCFGRYFKHKEFILAAVSCSKSFWWWKLTDFTGNRRTVIQLICNSDIVLWFEVKVSIYLCFYARRTI